MEYGLVIWWLAAFLALMAIGMPLAAGLFPRLADRGAGLALPTALAVLWVVAYLVGHLSLTVGLWVGLAVLVVAAAVLVYRDVEIDWYRYGEAALVFTIAFLFLVAVRSVDASVHAVGGEKFLDFGLLNSILRANALPPEDMWFAGQPVQYYYGGHLLAALLTKLTGTMPRFAYNLALSGFYATLVTAAYGLAGSIAASRDVSRVRAGIFGAFFVGFASNVSTVSRFVYWLVPDSITSVFAGMLDIDPGGIAASGPSGFGYWAASRVIEGTINEFPLFAWLNGDLHAHMMSTPFVLLVAGLLFSYYTLPEEAVTKRRLLVFGCVPPLTGMLAVVNTWSFPIAGGLTFLALALAPADPLTLATGRDSDRRFDRGATRELARHVGAFAGGIGVVLVGLVWSLPFWLGTASTRSIGLFPDRSGMGEFVLVHGAFLLLFAIYLARHGLPALDADHTAEVAVMLVIGVVLAWVGGSAVAIAILGPMILVGWILLRTQAGRLDRLSSAAVDRETGAVSDGGAGAAVADDTGTDHAVVDRVRDAVGFETVMLIAGAGVVILVEFIYVKEQAAPGRFNTVFKTYADVWILWAVPAGAVLAHLVENHSPDLALSGGWWKPGFRFLAVVLVASTAMYGVLALSDHFSTEDSGVYNHPDEPTLDALHFVQDHHPVEANAIAWFDDLEGQPNIASAPGTNMYDWTNPVASLTGVPTLAGWHHEVGYRGEAVYDTRVSHVDVIYTGTPEARAHFLAQYNVEYVYVGSNEHERYSTDELAAFESMDGVALAQQWETVRVYRVNQDELDAPSG